MEPFDMKILITGIGGDIGINIGRILRSHYDDIFLLGCDCDNRHLGELIFDKCAQVPMSNENNYFQCIENLVTEFDIDAIFATSELELRILTSKEVDLPKVILERLIWSNFKSRMIGFDKFETSKFLRFHDLPYPLTCKSKKLPDKYPVIFKDRYGSGNSSILKVHNLTEAKLLSQVFPSYIWQEFLDADQNEYTCCVYGSGKKNIVIIFKRKLSAGITIYAESVENHDISDLCKKIADKLELKGSINIQLRLIDDIPYVFEINPRFSSTVKIRDLIGFKDVIWSLEDKLNLTQDNRIFDLPIGYRISRQDNECLIKK
jgi:carbamoyl-phosphate synthase large subunit